ncbi:MAG: MFS transporter [Treponema sp.]|nr:MFS transporter [Treponema sp.]
MTEKILKEKKTNNPDRLPVGKFFAWKARDVSVAAINIVFGFLMIFCTDTLGMPAALVGTLLMASKIFDGFTDLFAAYVIENTHTRLGKARPYEFCLIGVWICTFLIFCASPEWSLIAKSIWVCSMYTLVFSIFTTLVGAANTPYMIRAFGRRQVLVKVSSYGGIVTMVGAMAVSVSFPMVMAKMATSPAGWRQMIALYSIPLLLIGLLRLIFVKEVVETDSDTTEKIPVKQILKMLVSNRYIWVFAGMMGFFNVITNMNVAVYFFRYYIGNLSLMGVFQIFSIVMLLGMFFMPQLTKRFSTPTIIGGGAILSVIGYAIVFLAGTNLVLLAVGGLLAGLVTFPVSYLQILIIMDLCTFNEWKGVPRMEVTVSLGGNLFSKIGQGVGAGLLGILLGAAGYDGAAATQPDSAILMIRMLYSLIPGVGILLILLFARVLGNFSKRVPQMAKDIEERKKAANAAVAEFENSRKA